MTLYDHPHQEHTDQAPATGQEQDALPPLETIEDPARNAGSSSINTIDTQPSFFRKHLKEAGVFAVGVLAATGGLLAFNKTQQGSEEQVTPKNPTAPSVLPPQASQAPTTVETTPKVSVTEAIPNRDPFKSSTGHIIEYKAGASSEVTGGTGPHEPLEPPVMPTGEMEKLLPYYKDQVKRTSAAIVNREQITYTENLCLVETRKDINLAGKPYTEYRFYANPIHTSGGGMDAYFSIDDSDSNSGIAKLSEAPLDNFDGVVRAGVVRNISAYSPLDGGPNDAKATVEGSLNFDGPPAGTNPQGAPLFTGDLQQYPNINWDKEGSGAVATVDGGNKKIVGAIATVVSIDGELSPAQQSDICKDILLNAG